MRTRLTRHFHYRNGIHPILNSHTLTHDCWSQTDSWGLCECAALLPLVPRDVPVAVSVVWGELGAGAGDLDDVAVAEGVVEPLRVLWGHVDATVGDVSDALVGHRPWCGVGEDAGVRQPGLPVGSRSRTPPSPPQR